MEVIKYGCRTKTGNICEKCEERGWRGPSLTRIPKPYPDRDAGHYFSVAATPAINRTVDDCLPRSQMKRLFEEGKIGVDTIGDFCKEYLVDERVAQDYLNHLQLLSAKVLQRKQNRLEAAAARRSHVRTRRTIGVNCISNRDCPVS